MTTKKKILTLIEIGVVVLSGFLMSIAMKWLDIQFFALPHLVFLLTAIIFRSALSNWKLADYGIKDNLLYQINLGLLIWLVVQTYYAILHILSPLFIETAKLGATIFEITAPDALRDKIINIALVKAGIIETLRYFSYAQGLLMEIFGPALGAIMAFAYFGSAHMGIMNLIVLPVSFLYVYYYRTYKLIIPLIIFHALGDTSGFIQNYLSYKELYIYNYIIFIVLLSCLWIFKKEIKGILMSIIKTIKEDYCWFKNNKLKTAALSLILPIWLHLLLFIDAK